LAEWHDVEAWQRLSGDMPADEFRHYGREVIDWIAHYLDHPEAYPVLSQVEPGAVRQALPASPPATPERVEAVLRDFQHIILPGITHWNHPAFFAYFAISGSAPGILGETLAAALNVNAMLWRTSPAATELEEVTLSWLRQLLDLPASFQGIIYDTASISTLVAVAAAREATGLDVRTRGLSGLPRLRLYCSQQAHSSVEKAAITLGIGQDGVRKIPTDREFRMEVEALRDAVEEDRRAGHRPFCVVATAGTTSTTSVDPVPVIAAVCREHGLWLHVDGAYGGTAAILPEKRWILEGVEHADSIVVNPHKWLFTPIDLSAFYTRRLDVVRQAFSLVPEYLRTDDADVRNYMDYGPQLGRRFRALKLWFVLRTYGREGIVLRLREHMRLAGMLADWINASPDWELLAPVPLGTVCFRYKPSGVSEGKVDTINQQILARLNASGSAFLSHTVLSGHYTIRLSVGNIRTTEDHVRRVWADLREIAERCLEDEEVDAAQA
jgi:aromatic-L-amino-acid decarboxylase